MNAWLVLDTSQPLATVAVVDGARVLGEHVLSEPKRHAESLVDALDRALIAAGLTLADVRGVGVGRGPGSFIGVRTGIAFAKGLALGLGVPLLGLPSILALVAGAPLPADLPAHLREGAVGLGVVDAKRGQLFAQRVRMGPNGLEAIEEPSALTPPDALAIAKACAFVVGVGVDDARLVALRGPTAAGLARTLSMRLSGDAGDETDVLVPDYVRGADAKLPVVDPASRRGALFGDT